MLVGTLYSASLLGQLTLGRLGAAIWRGKECPLPQRIYSQGTDPWEA
jgi:hypothetical protein